VGFYTRCHKSAMNFLAVEIQAVDSTC
jgi:hypothetical protein